MAWLIIRVNSNPAATSWKAGDIVEVRDDAYVTQVGWGSLEGLPALYRIHVTDLDANRVKRFLERSNHTGTIDNPVFVRVRTWGVRVAELPAPIQTQLQSTGVVEMTTAQIVAAIKDDGGNVVVLP